MISKAGNIIAVNSIPGGDKELFETILQSPNIKIERIISSGQVTPPGEWYEQKQHEFVLLLQGRASIELVGGKIMHLSLGDYLEIPAGLKHRVSFTSNNPACIWLAVFYD